MDFQEFRKQELGKTLGYQEHGKPEDGGVVVDAELVGAVIYNSKTKEENPAFRYRLYRTEGPKKGKAFWTTSFAFDAAKAKRTIETLNEINTKTEEGRMLLASIAILTTGTYHSRTPDKAISLINVSKNLMTFED